MIKCFLGITYRKGCNRMRKMMEYKNNLKRSLILLPLIGLLLAPACGRNDIAGIDHSPSNSEVITGKTGEANSAEKANDEEVDASGISKIIINDIENNTKSEHTDSGLIKEFCAFIDGLSYSTVDSEHYEYYKIELIDTNGDTAAIISVSGWTIEFDRDMNLGGKQIKEGVYNAGQWISPYIKKFSEGTVMDPVYIRYPAAIKIPDGMVTQQLSDHGNTKINSEEIHTGIYEFLYDSFVNREFMVINSGRYFDRSQLEDRLSKIKNGSESIVVYFSTSESFAEITADNGGKQCAKADEITIAAVSGKPGVFEFITNNMIFEIEAGNDFAGRFEAIFTANRSLDANLTPEDIRKLFEEKKPYYMEFICKNLGIEEWQGRDPDRLEISSQKLNEEKEPYTVVSIYNPFDVRLLFFSNEKGNPPKFIDYIDFGGRYAGTEYNLETWNRHVFIVGNKCYGYGTGESRYYQDWYEFLPGGKKLVLSFPYDDYSFYHAGGYAIKADSIQIKTVEGIRVCADYTFTTWYPLQIDIAGNDGMVELKTRKTVEYRFDQSNGYFNSDHVACENGVMVVNPAPAEIMSQCNEILEKYYDELVESLKSGNAGENRYITEMRFDGMKRFLNDCAGSDKKAKLEEILNSEYQRFSTVSTINQAGN